MGLSCLYTDAGFEQVNKDWKGEGSGKEQPRQLGLFSREDKRLRGELISPYSSLKGHCSQVRGWSLLPSNKQEEMASMYQGRFKLSIRKKNSLKGFSVKTQGSGRITIPLSVPKACG